MNLNEPINIEDLYNIRMIVLIECEPQSNQYHQVRLTKEQFIHVSDAIAECFEGTEDSVTFRIDDVTHIRLPDNIQDYYAETE